MKEKRLVLLEDIAPDTILAEAVVDAAGRVLMPAGGIVSETALASLSRRGVERLTVWCTVEMDPAALAAARERQKRQLDHLFRRVMEDPPSRVIYDAVLTFRIQGVS